MLLSGSKAAVRTWILMEYPAYSLTISQAPFATWTHAILYICANNLIWSPPSNACLCCSLRVT